MNKYINMLLQIQELEIILKEKHILTETQEQKDSVLRELRQDIQGLKQNIPFDIMSFFDRVFSKHGLAVCPMINSVCTGCSMKLPIGIANNILSSQNCVACPNCGRYLFCDEQLPNRPGAELKQYKGIVRFSSPDLMFPNIKAKTKEDVIKFLAKKTFEAGFVENADQFTDALLKRESIVSTAVGAGISFPHARGVKACGLTLAVGTVANPIKEDGFDDGLRIFFMSAVPLCSSVFYLELISKLANYFAKNNAREKLLNAGTPNELWKIMALIGR
jgi:mannitol/fructose-specific phosphotransferase system IIA component (Ntr-type)